MASFRSLPAFPIPWQVVLLVAVTPGCANREPIGQFTREPLAPFSDSGLGESAERWWTLLGNAESNARVDQAFRGSYDLAAALQRVAAAWALARRQASDFFPDVDGVINTESNFGPGEDRFPSVIGLDASYQVDLWGRIESQVEAERFRTPAPMTDPPASRTAGYWMGVAFSVFACAGILAASVGTVVLTNQTEPTAQTINAKRKSAALVETITVRRGTYRPKIEVLGTVQAAQEVNLRPRVSGQVVELSPGFVPGGMVRRGESLLKIDPADFENALSISRSELEQAEAALAIESGRQSLAEKELKMLQVTVDAANRALVLREPQIASIRAEVKATASIAARINTTFGCVPKAAPSA